jgi:gamma-glutamyl hercynylcysteine S-oxide synthase
MIETRPVPGGNYLIGASSGDTAHQPRHTIQLKTFAIGRTTVSNGQFHNFIRAGGYTQAEFWTTMGWRWQNSKQPIRPAFWDDDKLNHPLQPVVGIAWYTALAFARWLSLETGQGWHLPTEVQWEVAAQPPGELPYRAINSAELGLDRTWSVLGNGQVSTVGAHDMLGNVWEWTTSRWGRNWQTLEYNYPYEAEDGREDLSGSHARVMRGGSWFDPRNLATPRHRGRYLPGSRGSNIGFRLINKTAV